MPDTRPTHGADDPAEQPSNQTATQTPQPATNGLDADALAAKLNEGLKSGLKDALEGYAQQNPQPRQPVSQPVTQPAGDPVRDFLNPYLEPMQRAVVVRTEAAMDAATFYSDPDPKQARLKSKLRGEVEQLFSQQLQQGQYIPRENLFHYLRGLKFQEFVDAEIAEREQAREQAKQAQGVGTGSARPMGQQNTKQPWEMTPEELERALDGVAF